MEDRQCKICLQFKPLEEFQLWGERGRRSFTCRDCVGINAPVEPLEFRRKGIPQIIKMCCVDDCDEPASDGHPKCYRHMLEQWAEARNSLRPHGDTTTCIEPGCNEPRAMMKSGKFYQRCEEHQKAYNAAKNRGSREKKGTQSLTEAQKHAGFDRNPRKANKDSKVELVCIIDHNADTMTFMEVKITLQCKSDALNMLPLSWRGVTESIAAKGYKIVERGERPEGVLTNG